LAVDAYLLGLPTGVVSIVPDAEAGPLAERRGGGVNVKATEQADRARVARPFS
jgi:hypothetical protein